MAADSVIELVGIGKTLGNVTPLKDVSLAVATAEAVAVVGPSGAGKTTLLRLVAGLDEPTHGTILLRGQMASEPGRVLPPHRRGIGMVFQRPTLWPHLTVAQNVSFGLAAWPRRDAERRLAAVLETTHLSGLGDRRPHQLSGGEAQRAALARAIAPRPGILLLDEPLSGLDYSLHASLLGLLKQIRLDTGVTLLYVSHDHEEAAAITDRVVHLRRGVVEHDGDWGAVDRRMRW